MNFTESFQEFSSKLSTTDLALYAGMGLVLWVMFKDQLSPVQKMIIGVVEKIKTLISGKINRTPSTDMPKIDPVSVPHMADNAKDDVFFQLVVSWKQTRDLAEQSGCSKAVEVADQMFPYLSPMVCNKNEGPKNEQV
jgi:hypothetical protein